MGSKVAALCHCSPSSAATTAAAAAAAAAGNTCTGSPHPSSTCRLPGKRRDPFSLSLQHARWGEKEEGGEGRLNVRHEGKGMDGERERGKEEEGAPEPEPGCGSDLFHFSLFFPFTVRLLRSFLRSFLTSRCTSSMQSAAGRGEG